MTVKIVNVQRNAKCRECYKIINKEEKALKLDLNLYFGPFFLCPKCAYKFKIKIIKEVK